jgi:hypothetical protein
LTVSWRKPEPGISWIWHYSGLPSMATPPKYSAKWSEKLSHYVDM